MAVERTNSDRPPGNRMEELLEAVRDRYVRQHGEEPSKDYMEAARKEILRTSARKNRDEHRDVYDALADE